MNNFITKIFSSFSENKRILIPLIPLILLISFVIILILFSLFTPTQQPPQEEQNFPNPTSVDLEITQPPISATPSEEHNASSAHGETILYEGAPNLEGKEMLPDGSIKYSFTTTTPGRPDVVITIGEEQNTVFERTVIPQTGTPILLSEYLDFFGQPERIISGSRFYGPNARTYIYAQSRGSAFIANSQSNRILELQTFAPMNVDEYIKRFGEDLLITPAP